MFSILFHSFPLSMSISGTWSSCGLLNLSPSCRPTTSALSWTPLFLPHPISNSSLNLVISTIKLHVGSKHISIYLHYYHLDTCTHHLCINICPHLLSLGLVQEHPHWSPSFHHYHLLPAILNTVVKVVGACRSWGSRVQSQSPNIRLKGPSWSGPLSLSVIIFFPLFPLVQPHWNCQAHSYLKAFAHAVPSKQNAFPRYLHHFLSSFGYLLKCPFLTESCLTTLFNVVRRSPIAKTPPSSLVNVSLQQLFSPTYLSHLYLSPSTTMHTPWGRRFCLFCSLLSLW